MGLAAISLPGGPSRAVAAGSRSGHPEARGRSKSQERGGPGPHAKPDCIRARIEGEDQVTAVTGGEIETEDETATARG